MRCKNGFRRCLCIHDRKVMAPLKPTNTTAVKIDLSSIHDRKVMAPLKHVEAWAAAVQCGGIHDRKVMAPLKRLLQGWLD